MRIFVFEYVTGGGCYNDAMVADLAVEGDLMLNAVVRDLLDIHGVEVLVCRDRRLQMPQLPIEVHWVEGDWQMGWAHCLAQADAVLPIAPESDNVLESLCHDVEWARKPLLNSTAGAVAIAADKQRTLDLLGRCGVPVVPSWRADGVSSVDTPILVVKPNKGVGCRGIHLLTDGRALGEFIDSQSEPSQWLVQPYLEGQAASLSLLVDEHCVCLLGCNVQRVAQVDDGFVLLGCVVNGLNESRELLGQLGEQVCRAIPGLWGYVGVDLVMTDRGPVVLEVNPRLTTSYAGIRRSTGWNVAELLIHMLNTTSTLPLPLVGAQSIHVDLELGRVA